MRAMNLYLLSRAAGGEGFSRLAQELDGSSYCKEYSRHEALSLRCLIDALSPVLREKAEGAPEVWISLLDGFYFSYTIAHISKEFDLLKLSADGGSILNIELKSEEIEEGRIRRQLEQNRYYLSHISHTIYSFTYVMELNRLYFLSGKGYMRESSMEELAEALMKPCFKDYVRENLDRYFRASDYLISPAATPEKFLQGNYFLTNQQTEFRRAILENFEKDNEGGSPPVITVIGTAGTGKTLLLMDLAMVLSRKKNVLFIHGGTLGEGHRLIDERLKKVTFCAADELVLQDWFSYFLIDEANRIPPDNIREILLFVRERRIPCVLAYDAHRFLSRDDSMTRTESTIQRYSTLNLTFSGNIRTNRNVFAFLCSLFHLKERPGHTNYNCIDVLCAGNYGEANEIVRFYRENGYKKIPLPDERGYSDPDFDPGELVGMEYDNTLIILDPRFYYNEDSFLCVRGENADYILSLLYEGISRTREKLCLIILENEELFCKVLSIRHGL